jgi:hypothetical protein
LFKSLSISNIVLNIEHIVMYLCMETVKIMQ